MEKSQNKELRKLIKKKLSSGCSKQEVYNELMLEKNSIKVVASMLDDMVSQKTKEKYSKMNTLLLVLLSILAFIDAVTLSYSSVIIDILLIISVVNYNIKYYTWIAIRGFFSIITIVILLFLSKENFQSTDPRVLMFIGLTFVLIIISFALGFYLSNKLSPDYTERKELYINENGESRLKILHEFQD